jgi:methanogenesis imperfect marker protein 11
MPETLTPDEVKKRFGQMFSDRLITMIDESAGKARIIEMCTAQGPVEWDAVNRWRAGGIVERIDVHGNWLIMDTLIGEKEVSFGPVSAVTGGQALKAVKVKNGIVETSWVGIAGASIGIGACLPQAKGVIRTEYEGTMELGGSSEVNVKIYTPEMRHLIIGMDDTDSNEKGATWSLGMRLGLKMPDAIFLQHKIIQLNHHAPHKTTNCTSTAVSFAVPPNKVSACVKFAEDFIADETVSDQTSMAVYCGLEIPPEVMRFGIRAKEIVLTIEEAEETARKASVQLKEVTGPRGKIGALAAIGCFELGLLSAGLMEDFREYAPTQTREAKRD